MLRYLMSSRSLRSSERGLKWLRGASVAVIRQSLRSSERGLKSPLNDYGWGTTVVAPFVGAWIEIYQITRMSLDKLSRSVRRSVD